MKKKINGLCLFLNSFLFSILFDLNAFAGDAAAEELKKILINDSKTGLLDITVFIGSVIMALGLGQMFLAFKDDNADAKSRATTVLLAGVFLILIKEILQKVGGL